jgi:PTS system nitrogen regulatory IIA component
MFLNIIELAESFGVPEAVVGSWIKHEGLPCLMNGEQQLFDRAQVAQWAAGHGLAAKTGFLSPGRSLFQTGCLLAPLLHPGCVWRDVPPDAVADCFEAVLMNVPGLAPAVKQHLAKGLRAPRGITWAPVGQGWAIPHPGQRISLGRAAGTLGVIYLNRALDQAGPSPDGEPITRLLFFIAPSPRAHLDLLGRISRLLAREQPAALFSGTAGEDEIRAALAASDAAGAGVKGSAR